MANETVDAASLLDGLSQLVAKAAAAITAMAADDISMRRKPDGSPVTAADEAAEAVVLDGLARLLPGVPVVAEEQAARTGAPPISSTFVLVDPLDGTKEFLAGRDEYTVNVALVSRGVPVLGIVAAPALGLLWRGAGDKAERLRLPDAAAQGAEPIHTRTWPQHGATALVSRSHSDSATDAFLARLPKTQRLACGSSLKFCRIAEGAADIYPRLGRVSEWDIAAGHAVVAAAGGKVTAPNGRPLTYGHAAEGFRVPGFVAWGDPGMRF
jgi:3'(2'), 5'-bisphosphate nucleotidase